MQVAWSFFLFVLLALSANAEKKKRRRLSKWVQVREMQKNLSALYSQVQTLSNPVQIHVHGMDDDVIDDSDNNPDDRKDVEQTGTHVHIHFNLPPYPMSSTHEQHDADEEYTYATCYMKPMVSKTNHEVEGYVALRQKPSQPLEIKVDLKGFQLPQNQRFRATDSGLLHGLHVHQYGDFENGCLSFGGHYNPESTKHGGMQDTERHAGDWGNVVVDREGNIRVSMTDSRATLFGHHSIIGRGIVIHERDDDLGKEDTKASMTTGDAGGRLNCCVIGLSKGGHW